MQRTGQLMYELSTIYPDISGIMPAYGWDAPLRAHRRGPAVHRPPSEFSASALRVRRLQPQRDRRLPGQPHPAAPFPRRSSSSSDEAFSIYAMIDLLVFGPHPDDLEIGLGGTIAATRRARHARRPVRSHGRRDGQQRHASRSGWPKRKPRAPVLGAAWRENLRWPDRANRQGSRASRRSRRRSSAGIAPVVAVPYWSDRHPDHVAASERADRSGVQRRPAPLPGRRRGRGSRSGSATTSSTTARRRRSSSTCRDHYEQKRAGARLPRQPVPAAGDRRRRRRA